MLSNKMGIWTILLLITLEYACFPLPSEILLPISGIIAKNSEFPFLVLLITSTICGLIGCTICYLIGNKVGYKLLLWFVKKFPSKYHAIESTKNKYSKSSRFYVSVGRLVPVCRTYVSFFSGIYKQKYLLFLMYSALGIIVWNFVLLGVGYYFFDEINVSFFYSRYKLVILFIISIYLIFRVIKKEIILHKSNSM